MPARTPAYTPAQVAHFKAAVFHRRAAGESLEAICADPDWPSRPTLRKWAREDPDFDARIAGGRSVHVTRPRYPFDADLAQRFLLRIRLGSPIADLVREPGMPQRRALTAWRRREPAFAAALAASTAFADEHRRRYGATARGCRRSRLPFDWDLADRIVLAVSRGATIPEITRRPEFPTRLGLRRWRRAHPLFDRVLAKAAVVGHRARGRARVDRRCSAALMDQIGERIAMGASLHSLAREPGMPGLHTLYKWVRERPDFAARVAHASDFRGQLLNDQAFDLFLRHGLAAQPQVNAIRKTLGQMNPHPGERRGSTSPARRMSDK